MIDQLITSNANENLANKPESKIERHLRAPARLRDVVIGMADGLTVPFALAAGLTGAVAASNIVVTAGLAEIAAGSIAMGLGGYLAARGDVQHYDTEYQRELRETHEMPGEETREIEKILREHGLTGEALKLVVKSITSDRTRWVDFMMRFELGLERPEPYRAPISAATIAIAYIVGGMIPLAPYILINNLHNALHLSIALTLMALLVFGWVKGAVGGVNRWRSAMETIVVGLLAAGAAFLLAQAITHQ